MSNSAPSNPPMHAALPADLANGLLSRLASHLAPLFGSNPDQLRATRLVALQTVASYQPRTQADFINVARIISFSMSALAALGRAAAGDLPPTLELRYFARANTLSRSADQNERALERRRRDQDLNVSALPQAWMGADGADPWGGEGGDVEASNPSVGEAKPKELEAELKASEVAIDEAVAETMADYALSRQSAPEIAKAVTEAGAELSGQSARAPRAAMSQGAPVRPPAAMPRVVSLTDLGGEGDPGALSGLELGSGVFCRWEKAVDRDIAGLGFGESRQAQRDEGGMLPG